MGPGSFGSPGSKFTTGGSNLASIAGDINGDGIPDLVVTSCDAGAIFIHLGNGDGTFTLLRTITVGSDPVAQGFPVRLVDVDGNGTLDIVTSNGQATRPYIFVYKNNGLGVFSGPFLSFFGGVLPVRISAGDLLEQ